MLPRHLAADISLFAGISCIDNEGGIEGNRSGENHDSGEGNGSSEGNGDGEVLVALAEHMPNSQDTYTYGVLPPKNNSAVTKWADALAKGVIWQWAQARKSTTPTSTTAGRLSGFAKGYA